MSTDKESISSLGRTGGRGEFDGRAAVIDLFYLGRRQGIVVDADIVNLAIEPEIACGAPSADENIGISYTN